MKIILASQSQRRKDLMDLLKIKYEVIESSIDEKLEAGLLIEEQSKKLGYIKAKAVFDKTQGDRIVIGSDTIVVKENEIFGKPKDKKDAKRILDIINNTNHTVMTSLAVLVQEDDKYTEYIDCDKTEVYIRKMTNEEIDEWIEEGEPYDKAGAYTIQSKFGAFINRIEGSYFTILGLPIHKLYDIIKKYI